MTRHFILAMQVFSFLFVQTAGANMLTNGDFGTGDFTGWTLSGNTSACTVSSASPPDGFSYAAYLHAEYPAGFISQTVAATLGQTYVLKGWFSQLVPGGDGNMGTAGFALGLTDQMTEFYTPAFESPQPSYSWYAFTIPLTATNPGFDVFWVGFIGAPTVGIAGLDLEPLPAVPLPSCLALLGTGLAALGAAPLRKRWRK